MISIDSFAAVKIIAFIFSFYILLLAVIPCCSFDDCPDDKTEQLADHSSGDEDCGNCSPFFNCNGCSTIAIEMQHTQILVLNTEHQIAHVAYQQPAIPSVEYDFWQPPRIG